AHDPGRCGRHAPRPPGSACRPHRGIFLADLECYRNNGTNSLGSTGFEHRNPTGAAHERHCFPW
ncbi:hypothetical protein HPB47_017036, partial [Ixodes persulcatus]